jgi:AcrR family transcriptional regulator
MAVPVKSERKLAPWLVGVTIETVGKVSDRTSGRTRAKQHRMHRSDRREQLLQACLTAFARDGLEITTMDSIAATAGVSKPLVYRHFHNRHEALVAVVERESERLVEVLGIGGTGATPPSFESLTTTFLTFAAEAPASFRLLFQLVDAAAGAAQRRVDQLRDRVGRVLVNSLLSQVDPVELPELPELGQDTAWLAGMVSSIVEGVAGGLARGEDPALRAGALCRLLRPEGLVAVLVEVRTATPSSGALPRERG